MHNLPAKPTVFDSIKHTDKNGSEFWHARELQGILEYARWDTFESVVMKAKQSLITAGQTVENHISDTRKMVSVGYGNERSIKDYRLSRYACYIIAQNGDASKEAIALAQAYFAQQTRRQEIREMEDKDSKRLELRKKLSQTEKRFSKTMHDRGVDGPGMAEIRSSGDEALFGGHSTVEMKKRYGIDDKKPLADVMPNIGIWGKGLATEMTTVNTENKDLKFKNPIKKEHISNNAEVREVLLKRNIKLEDIPPEEDTKKISRRAKKKDNKELT